MINLRCWSSCARSFRFTGTSRRSILHRPQFRLAPTLPRSEEMCICTFIAQAARDASTVNGQNVVPEATRATGEVNVLDARSRARRRMTQTVEPPRSSDQSEIRSDGGIPLIAVAVAAIAGLGVLAVLYNKFFANVGTKAKSAVEALPQTVTQVR